MAKGRRRTLTHQALLVWSEKTDLQRFIETGSLAETRVRIAPNGLADKIALDIERNGGRLIIDEARFAVLAKELEDARTQ